MRGKRKKGSRSEKEKVEVCGKMRQSKKHNKGSRSNNKGSSSSSTSVGSSNVGNNKGSSSSNGGFYGCYLLTSLSPRYKGHTYIGYTVNPKRRIRQHNGEICSGASTTKKKRPWEMVLCIHGFPSSTFALQFEWAWQHPKESIAVREAASSFKTIAGVANKIKLALTMLTLPSWLPLDLTVSIFSTKYMIHTAGAPSYLKLDFCSIQDLPSYSLDTNNANDHDHIPSQPHYYHLHLDSDDTNDIHPHSPPSLHQLHDDFHPHSPPSHQFSTESHQTTFIHHTQLTLMAHNTPFSTLSTDEQFTQKDDMIDDNINGNTQKDDMIDDNINGNTQQTHHHSPSTLPHIPPPQHTQVIDLVTPSPHNRIIRRPKKHTPPSNSPHIIDLTTSPLFLQL